MENLKCWNCLSVNLKYSQQEKCYICEACGAKREAENVANMADSVIEAIEAADKRKVYNLRIAIDSEIATINSDGGKIINHCEQLLEYVGIDYLASLYISYYKKSAGNMIYRLYLLEDISKIDKHILELAIKFVISRADVAIEKEVLQYAAKVAEKTGENISVYKYAIKNKFAEIAADMERYTEIPRDVFICHKSQDEDTARRIHERLKQEGITNYFAPYNLPQLTISGYISRLNYAIENSKIFLVVSSKILEYSVGQNYELNDALKEIEHCAKCGKNIIRMEIKIDDPNEYPRTVRLKKFMEEHGSYIDAFEDKFEKGLETLVESIIDVQFGASKTQVTQISESLADDTSKEVAAAQSAKDAMILESVSIASNTVSNCDVFISCTRETENDVEFVQNSQNYAVAKKIKAEIERTGKVVYFNPVSHGNSDKESLQKACESAKVMLIIALEDVDMNDIESASNYMKFCKNSEEKSCAIIHKKDELWNTPIEHMNTPIIKNDDKLLDNINILMERYNNTKSKSKSFFKR